MGLKSRLKNFTQEQKYQGKVSEPLVKPEAGKLETLRPMLQLTALTSLELKLKDVILSNLLDILDLSLISGVEEAEARKQISQVVRQLIEEQSAPLNARSREQIVKEVEDEVLGLGPLEPLLSEPTISDILVNNYHSVYIERFGRLELTPVRFKDNDHLMKIIDRIVSRVGRRIDESSPMVDARLADGSRVNAIIPPLAIDGASISIRRFSEDKMTLDDLVEKGALTLQMAEFLKSASKAKQNILISGGTGSGKTTMLNAMSNFIPADERIVTIEDSAELQLQLPHVVRLETRPANIEGKGEVSLRDLVKNSLRMRPDRIVIGEVRGGEAFDMLQAMNTGHDGSLTTVHANKPRDSLARVENMVSMAGFELPTAAVRKQIASAINIIVQLNRLEDGSRRVISIQEVAGMEGDIITLSEIFKFDRTSINEQGIVQGRYMATGLIPACLPKLQSMGCVIDQSFFVN